MGNLPGECLHVSVTGAAKTPLLSWFSEGPGGTDCADAVRLSQAEFILATVFIAIAVE